MRALAQSTTSSIVCRRCKREFMPTNSAQRCKTCLEKRRANRIKKRRESRVREAKQLKVDQTMKSVDRMMRNNSLNRSGKVRMFS